MKIHYFFYLLFLWIGRVALAQTTTENYVLSHTYRTATTTELSGNVFVGTSLTPATALVQTVISYLDGLGKPKLEVAVYNSPNQTTHNSGPFNKDIVVKTTYDAQQRPQYNYLPVTPAFGEGSYAFYTESNTYINRSDGAYRADVNMSYYNSSNNVCNTTTAAYIETRYETMMNPKNRTDS